MDNSVKRDASFVVPTPPLVQVIIPVYNSGVYLEECFSSLYEQTYTHWEAIVIDDASSDGLSPQICDKWAEKDARFKVVHLEENRGVSHARNHGLQHTTAEWIAFLDSDDILLSNHLESLVTAVFKGEASLAFTGYIPYKTPKGTRRPTGLLQSDKIYTTREIFIRTTYDNKGMGNYLWRCLFHRSLLDGIVFPEGRVYEDMSVFLQIISRAERIVHTGQATYKYRWTPSSIVHTKKLRNISDYCYALFEVYCLVERTPLLSPKDRKRLLVWPIKRIYQGRRSLICLPHSEEQTMLVQEMESMMKAVGLNPNLKVHHAFLMFFFSLKKRVYERILL